jgi:uncharacterized NAD(P)/FAD-binding protein YdhS
VIGAGASGTLVAAQFDRLAPMQTRLVLIGDQLHPARGIAYDTPYRANLLNVPAGNMSAFPDDKEHFDRWLAKHMPGSSAGTFAPRELYGDYLLNIFMKLRKYSEKVVYLNQKAVELTRQNDLWVIQLENGNVLTARSVVLALGNLLIPDDPIDFQQVRSFYYRNPWLLDVTKDLPDDAPVLVLGTGLTMVDVALSLRETGHRGVIHAISRHGRLYQAHEPYQPRPLQELPDNFNSPVGALRWICREITNAESTGNNWRAVIDSLRPHTASIWQGWSLSQRRTFLRHARNLWDTHRHRMAPEIADQLSKLIEDRTLVIHHGMLLSAQTIGDKATILWKDKETNEAKFLSVARIINCTGPSRDITKVHSPLVSKLLTTGWISPDPLKLGVKTDIDGRLHDRNGNPSPGLYTLGPLRIAGLWESIAIPEIRCQAQALAQLLVDELIEAGVPA